MPKSKRTKSVSLTQTAKKSRVHKASIIQGIRNAIDQHSTLYVFSYNNMRSNHFKEIRMHFRPSNSRIILGKNTLMQRALGQSPEDEYSDNLRHVSKMIQGTVGLLFTNESHEKVQQYFSDFRKCDFARAGYIASQMIMLTNDMLEQFPVSMVDLFRKLGLPVDVCDGKLILVGGQTEHRLCRKGDVLSAEVCKVLTQLGMKLVDFRVTLMCRWNSRDGSIDEF